MADEQPNMGGVPTDTSNSVPNQITSGDSPQGSFGSSAEGTPTYNEQVNVSAPTSSGPQTDTSNNVPNQIPQQQQPKSPQQQSLPPNAPPDVVKAFTGAHKLRGIMDVLGLSVPQYKTVINDDGSSKQVAIPRRGRDVGMALAVAAISGAFSGLGERGPGATGRAAQQGFATGSGLRQTAQNSADAQSQQDFTRKQQTLEFNMRMRNQAMDLGMKDKSSHDAFVDSFSHQVDALENLPNSGDIIKFGTREAPLTEDEADDIVKHSPFNLMRIPVSTVPRTHNGENVYTDPTGKITTQDGQGAYQAWDNGYVLVDKNAKIPLSNADGPLPELSKLIKRSGDILGIPKSILAGDGVKEPILASTYGSWLLKDASLTSMQNTMDSFTKTINGDKTVNDSGFVKPTDIRDAIRNKQINFKDVENFSKVYGGTSQGNTTPLNAKIDAIAKADPQSASRLEKFFGLENLHTYKENILNADAADKTAREKAAGSMSDETAKDVIAKENAKPGSQPQAMVTRAKSVLQQGVDQSAKRIREEEAVRQDVQDKQHAELQGYLIPPSTWSDEDAKSTMGMSMGQARSFMQSKGVKIPDNFATLFSVAHNADDIGKAFTTRLSKGTGQMDHATAESWIKTYFNPEFQASDFGASKKWNEEVASGKPGTPGGSLLAAGTAVQHLKSWIPIFKSLNNGNVQVVNQGLNAIAQQFGRPAQAEAKLFASNLAAETEKVVAGSVPHETRMADLQKQLSNANSPDQFVNISKDLLDLMHGRLEEINERNTQLFQRPVKGISPDTSMMMLKAGLTTPWLKKPDGATQTGTIKGIPHWADAQGKDLGPVNLEYWK